MKLGSGHTRRSRQELRSHTLWVLVRQFTKLDFTGNAMEHLKVRNDRTVPMLLKDKSWLLSKGARWEQGELLVGYGKSPERKCWNRAVGEEMK